MLNLTPSGLQEEVTQAAKYLEEFNADWEEVVGRYHGPGFYSEHGEGAANLENHEAELVSLLLPRAAGRALRALVETGRRHEKTKVEAKSLQFALNRSLRELHIQELQHHTFVDFVLKFGMIYVKPESEDADIDEMDGWPSFERISPDDALIDTQARSSREWRFIGHWIREDRNDILDDAERIKDEGWNTDMLQELDMAPRDPDTEVGYVDRDQVEYCRLWVPEADPEDFGFDAEEGQHGMVFYLPRQGPQASDGEVYNGDAISDEGEGRWLREPEPFYGPRIGCYSVGYSKYVPDSPIGMSDTAMTRAQAEDVNLLAEAESEMAREYKRVFLAGDPMVAEKLKNAKHGGVYTVDVDDFKKEAMVAEFGGLTDAVIMASERARQRLDRNTGLHEAMRGNPMSDTATEAQIASNAAQDKLGWIIDQFHRMWAKALEIYAWYLAANDKVVIELTDVEAAEVLGIPLDRVKQLYRSGAAIDYTGGDDFEIDDFEFTVEAFSTQRMDGTALQQKAAEVMAVVQLVGEASIQWPHIDLRPWFEREAARLGAPWMLQMIDWTRVQRLQLMMLQGDLPPFQGGSGPQARLGKDTPSRMVGQRGQRGAAARFTPGGSPGGGLDTPAAPGQGAMVGGGGGPLSGVSGGQAASSMARTA